MAKGKEKVAPAKKGSLVGETVFVQGLPVMVVSEKEVEINGKKVMEVTSDKGVSYVEYTL